MNDPTVLLFLKAPVPGRVKTRLAADIGDEAAVAVYRQLAEQQIHQIPSNWRLRILFDPPRAEEEMKDWLGETHEFHPQRPGDLGGRLRAGVEQAFSGGADQVFCIGADCPCLHTENFLKARRMLQSDADVVVIPAEDGGFVLLGMKKPDLSLFDDIPWSQPNTLDVTLKRAEALNLTVDLLPPCFDIDTLTDLKRAIHSGCLTLPKNINTGVCT